MFLFLYKFVLWIKIDLDRQSTVVYFIYVSSDLWSLYNIERLLYGFNRTSSWIASQTMLKDSFLYGW